MIFLFAGSTTATAGEPAALYRNISIADHVLPATIGIGLVRDNQIQLILSNGDYLEHPLSTFRHGGKIPLTVSIHTTTAATVRLDDHRDASMSSDDGMTLTNQNLYIAGIAPETPWPYNWALLMWEHTGQLITTPRLQLCAATTNTTANKTTSTAESTPAVESKPEAQCGWANLQDLALQVPSDSFGFPLKETGLMLPTFVVPELQQYFIRKLQSSQWSCWERRSAELELLPAHCAPAQRELQALSANTVSPYSIVHRGESKQHHYWLHYNDHIAYLDFTSNKVYVITHTQHTGYNPVYMTNTVYPERWADPTVNLLHNCSHWEFCYQTQLSVRRQDGKYKFILTDVPLNDDD